MALKTWILVIVAMLLALMVPSKAKAQSATDSTQSAGDSGRMDCAPIMKELRHNKSPRDVAAELSVPVPTVYKCMRAARTARTRRIGEPSARATGVGGGAMATPSPTPIM